MGGNNTSTAYSGVLGGSGSLIKAGTNDLTLTVANSYSGGTTINSGRIILNAAASSLGSGTVSVASGGELYMSGSTLGNTIYIMGDGTNGADTNPRGALRLDAGAAISGSGSVVLQGNASIGSWSGVGTVNAPISGNYNLTVNKATTNTGTVVFGGSNSYNGTTTVAASTLIATTSAALPYYSSAGSVSVAGGATLRVNAGGSGWSAPGVDLLAQNAAFASGSFLDYDTTNASVADSANLSGNFGLTKSGPNTLTLSGTSSYLGPTTITGGTLNVTGVVPATGAIINGGTLITAGPLGGLSLASGGLTLASTSINSLSAGTANIAAGTMLSNIALGSPGNSSQIKATSLTLPTSGSAITVNLTDNAGTGLLGTAGTNGVYPIISYTSLSGGNATFNSTFAVGTKPAALSSGKSLNFINTGTGTGAVDLAVTSQNPVLYLDTFNRSSGTNNMTGSSPTVQNGASNTWTGSTWTTATTNGGQAATIAAGDGNYIGFTPVAGNVYTYSVNLNPASGTTTNWLAIGFANSTVGTGSPNSAADLAWMLERDSGLGQMFEGSAGGTSNGVTMTTAYNGLQTNTIVLDTHNGLGNSTLTWYVGGIQQRTVTGFSASTIRNILFGTNNVAGTAQNLSLTSGPTWNVVGGATASWNNSANWAAGFNPSGAGSTATLPPIVGASGGTMTLDANQSVGQLTFANGSAGNYTIAQGTTGTLTFDNSGVGAAVTSYYGNNTISAPMGLNDNLQVLISTGNTLNLAGSISDTGTHSLAVNPTGTTGTLLLTNSSSYLGGTTLYGGTLQLGTGVSGQDGSLAGSGGINLAASAASLVYNLYGPQTYAGAISGNGSLTNIGTGGLTLSGSSTYTGPTVLRAGTLTVTGTIGGTGLLDPGGPSGAALVVNGGAITSNGASYIGWAQTGNTASVGTVYMPSGSLSAKGDTVVGYVNTVGGSGTGTFFQAGGSFTQAGGAFYIGVLNAAGTATGAYNISGGTLTNTSGGAFNVAAGAGTGNPVGMLNVNGGSVVANNAFNTNIGTATINLGGGVLATPAWTSTASTTLNFNGGTLQSGAASTNFLAR